MKIKNILLNVSLTVTLSTAFFSCSSKESSLGMFGGKSDKPDKADKQGCTKETTRSSSSGMKTTTTTTINPCDKPDCPAKTKGF